MALPPGAHVKGGQAAAPVHASAASAFYAPILPVVLELHRQKLSLREMAAELEKRGIRPRNGRPGGWSASQVRRVLQRAGVTATARTATAAVPLPLPPAEQSRPGPIGPATKLPSPPAAGVVPPVSNRQQQPPAQPVAAAPPARRAAATADAIYLRLGGERKGPYTEAQVRNMLKLAHVGPGTFGQREGSEEWLPLRTLFGLPGI